MEIKFHLNFRILFFFCTKIEKKALVVLYCDAYLFESTLTSMFLFSRIVVKKLKKKNSSRFIIDIVPILFAFSVNLFLLFQ